MKKPLPWKDRLFLEHIIREHTTKKIADRYGIARATIHRAIAGDPVNSGTRALIDQILEDHR
jgi:AcrR family transcriptional regulator